MRIFTESTITTTDNTICTQWINGVHISIISGQWSLNTTITTDKQEKYNNKTAGRMMLLNSVIGLNCHGWQTVCMCACMCVCMSIYDFGKIQSIFGAHYNRYSLFSLPLSISVPIWLPYVCIRYTHFCLFFLLLLHFLHINRYTDWHKWYKNNTIDSRHRHNGAML